MFLVLARQGREQGVGLAEVQRALRKRDLDPLFVEAVLYTAANLDGLEAFLQHVAQIESEELTQSFDHTLGLKQRHEERAGYRHTFPL